MNLQQWPVCKAGVCIPTGLVFDLKGLDFLGLVKVSKNYFQQY